MTDADQKIPAAESDRSAQQQFWPDGEFAYSDLTDPDEPLIGDLATSFTSLGYIRGALRRRVWVWLAWTAIGLLAGFGLLAKYPPGYQASSSVLVASTYSGAINDDQAIAQSRTVAEIAVRKLGLHETSAAFDGAYTVVATTGRVLTITAKAKSSTLAVSEANAIAAAFLEFQARQLTTEDRLLNASLQQQVTQAKQHVTTLSNRIDALSHQLTSASAGAEFDTLRAERTQASAFLTSLEQTVTSSEASNQESTTATLKNSQVLDSAVPIKTSFKKSGALYIGGGLLGGLVLGLGIVVIGALITDKLRRREDVARALGASVRLSVGPIRRGFLRNLPMVGGDSDGNVERVVTHLDEAALRSSGRPPSLAVVPVDDVRVPAECVVAVAKFHSRQGWKVIVADLCSSLPAARLLGVNGPGIHMVESAGAEIMVVVPDPGEMLSTGPFQTGGRGGGDRDRLSAAAAKADLHLALVPLDPALGADHLASWASAAVPLVTAGHSSAVRIHAVGEMISLAGVPMVSAVLIGADTADESLGLAVAPSAYRDGLVAGIQPAAAAPGHPDMDRMPGERGRSGIDLGRL